jgi:CubicO group peptidase (beta-lactamase class C family)
MNEPMRCRARLLVMSAACASLALALPVRAADPPADAPKGPAAALQPFVDRGVLAGAVTLAATKDAVLSLEAVGYADVAGKVPMRTDALFWIASQSKSMTAAALMMLVDEGKVNVEDPVEKYLPEFKGQLLAAGKEESGGPRPPARPVTVRDLLTHTSGLPFSSPAEQPTLDGLPLRDAVLSYAKLQLLTEPGARYRYSNAGINTAARILEVVSGEPYEAFMQKRLFDPLGMKDTTFWPDEGQAKRLAKAYKPNTTKDGLEETTISQLRYPLTDRARRFPMPAGGLFSTAQDVGRFCRMILAGGELDGKRYLSEAALRQMTTRQTPAAIKDSYGFGWSAGDGWCGHGGALATNMTVDTKRGLITVFLVQHAGFPADGQKSHGAFKQAAERMAGR